MTRERQLLDAMEAVGFDLTMTLGPVAPDDPVALETRMRQIFEGANALLDGKVVVVRDPAKS